MLDKNEVALMLSETNGLSEEASLQIANEIIVHMDQN